MNIDPLEIVATAFVFASVVLAVFRSLWQFPTGLIGVTLSFFLLWKTGLYASAVLQPVFFATLIYGWWYWMRGDNRRAPPIRATPLVIVGVACLAAALLGSLGAWALAAWTNAAMPLPDAIILALSIVAQVLLSLKRIETWHVWVLVNALSVYVYGSQGLWLYAALYGFFFFNAFWGWWEWRREMRQTEKAGEQPR
jgi:nicotinamide mononucleotide transporter